LEASKTVQPADRTIVLGRGLNCDVVVNRDGVSRDHARLQLRGGTWSVSDLASTNGTWLNDVRVRSPVPIEPQDTLRLGRWVVELELDVWAAETLNSELHSDLTFDGFISYKHGASDALAEALEIHLGQFGRDLFEKRELNLFLDKGQLTASSNLWERLEEALEGSEHLVVLACPEWAASRWCRVELEWWLANRGVRDLVIVHCGGEIHWGNGDFDWERTTALPRALRGWFNAEPLWIDARQVGHRSLQNPRYRRLVARLSAALHRTSIEDVDSRYRARRVWVRVIAAAAALLVAVGAVGGLAFMGLWLGFDADHVVGMSGQLVRGAELPGFGR
jgi:hypothetical protein